MSIINKTACAFVMCTALASCNSDLFVTHNGNMPSNDRISMVQKGQDKVRVREILGAPSSISPINSNTWIYMSSDVKRVAFFKPVEIDRDVLTIKFNDDGVVQSVSRYSKEEGRDIEISKDATEFQESQQGFFKEYFGGVGAYMPFKTNEKR